jgi:hypothetical protein
MIISTDIYDFFLKIYNTPYETFSRFLHPNPHFLEPVEAMKHIDQGYGLSCAEKAKLVAYWLTEKGIKNEIVSGGFELWLEGKNLTAIKGDLSKAPNDQKIIKFFDPDYQTSSYETPAHASHWANYFEYNNEKYLVDTTGIITTFKLFVGKEVEFLLNDSHKSYLTYMPNQSRQYYHRISSSLLEAIQRKQSNGSNFILGNFLGTALITGTDFVTNLKWWWDDESYERDIKAINEFTKKITNNEVSCTQYTTPKDLFTDFGKDFSSRQRDEFSSSWNNILVWTDKVFEGPKHVRILFMKSKSPMVNYSSNVLKYP